MKFSFFWCFLAHEVAFFYCYYFYFYFFYVIHSISLSPTLKKFDELTKTLVCEGISLDILLTGTREDAGPPFFLSSSKRESL